MCQFKSHYPPTRVSPGSEKIPKPRRKPRKSQNQKLNMDTGIAMRMKKENGFVISSVTKKRMVLYHR